MKTEKLKDIMICSLLILIILGAISIIGLAFITAFWSI